MVSTSFAGLHGAAAALHKGGLPASPADLWHHGWLPLGVVLPVALTSLLYYRGLRTLRSSVGAGRMVSPMRVAAFGAGVLALLVALASPLDPAGEVLFSAHMVQHLVLILVAAPLLVLGAPERVVLWGFGLETRRALARWGRRVGAAVGPLAGPGPAVAIATATLWLWHIPTLYDMAVEHQGLHALEHASFLITALLFWWTLLQIRTRRADRHNGGRLLALFAMVVQGSLLGALITLASRPLYASHSSIPEAWRLEPLVDQQLAGLIMWVPPAALYLGVASWLFLRLLGSTEERAAASERRTRVEAALADAGSAAAPEGGA